MPPVTVQQYKPSASPLRIGDEALAALLTNYRDRIEVAPAIGGGVTLTGGSYVGVISVPDLDIFITPKIAPLSVFWMLAYADRLVKFLPTEVAFGTEDGVLEVLVRLFARQTSLLIRHGLHRDYVERTEAIPFVRGRIALLDDVRVNRGLHHQAVCRFSELTGDVPHNQILRAVTEVLLRFNYRSPGISELLARNLGPLLEAEPAEVSPRTFAALHCTRLNQHYEPVLRLAELIVRHVTVRHEVGALRAPSFLIDMNLVYQEFLTRLIGEQAASRGLRLVAGRSLYLDEGHAVRLKPDIVLGDGHTIRVAIDAKYKRFDPESDVYQALAYAKALNLQRVALVYPSDGEIVPATHRIRNDDVSILVRTVPVGTDAAGFVGLDLRAAQAARELLVELDGALAGRQAA
jgi:5-methylcytosine-specific restriction enzyme subunit McrC